MAEFRAFPKIPRFRREMIITEKIDGTNACVVITPDEAEENVLWVTAQSRNKVITPESDNHGFAQWVEDNKRDLTHLGEGYHFGEWWGGSIQRGYGRKEKTFSLFNTRRWTNNPDLPACCSVVPVISQSNDVTSVEDALEYLRENGSFAAPGFMDPEGICIFHTSSRSYFKVLLDGDDVPKGLAA